MANSLAMLEMVAGVMYIALGVSRLMPRSRRSQGADAERLSQAAFACAAHLAFTAAASETTEVSTQQTRHPEPRTSAPWQDGTTSEDPMNRRAVLLVACLFLGYVGSVSAQATPRSGGARSGGAAPTASSLLGNWEFTAQAPDGAQTFTIAFERIEGALRGTGQGQFGTFQVADIMQTASDLAFTMRFEANGTTFDIPFKGKVTGSTAEGSLEFAMGGAAQSIPWTAKKLP